MQLINAKSGYVLDSGGEVGRVTIASPTLFMYEIQVKGPISSPGEKTNSKSPVVMPSS
jgi:tripeptide aminopeptidase